MLVKLRPEFFCLEGVALGLYDQFIHRDRRAKQEDPDRKREKLVESWEH